MFAESRTGAANKVSMSSAAATPAQLDCKNVGGATTTSSASDMDGGNAIACRFGSGAIVPCIDGTCSASSGAPDAGATGTVLYLGVSEDDATTSGVGGWVSDVCVDSRVDGGGCP